MAGTGSAGSSGDGGPATVGLLYSPYGVAVDASDNVYIADADNNKIRKVRTVYIGSINVFTTIYLMYISQRICISLYHIEIYQQCTHIHDLHLSCGIISYITS